MKKAFTLIELMITILIATIFLNFVFRFYTNVLMEVRYLEAKDSLSYNGFRALQIIKNGVRDIHGVITLKDLNSSNHFTSNDNNVTTIDIIDKNLRIKGTNNFYRFQGININKNSIIDIANGLYIIEFNATKESILGFSDLNSTKVVTFQRLVYTR